MECARFRDEVVRGLLEPSPDAPGGAAEAALAEHRAGCADCRRHEEELRALWRNLGVLAGPAPDPERMKAVEAALVGGREGELRTGAEGMRSGRSNSLLVAGVAAALIAGGAVGFGLGRAGAAERLPGPSGAPAGPSGTAGNPAREFLLLLRDSDATIEAQARVGVDSLVAEYAAWAGGLAEAGRLVSAEKLADDGGRWLGAAPDDEAVGRPPAAVGGPPGAPGADARTAGPTTGVVSGFFLVRAGSYEEALALAGESPHLRYGGAIEVREIDRGDR